MTPWKVIAAFIGVFVAGSIFGGFFALRMDRERAPKNRSEQQQTTGSLHLRLMRRFAEQLDLTAEQKETLAPVMKRAGEDIRRVQQSQSREMTILVERLQQDIAQVLTPEQKVKLEAMKQQQRERLKSERERFGGPGRDVEILPRPREGLRERTRDGGGSPKPTQP